MKKKLNKAIMISMTTVSLLTMAACGSGGSGSQNSGSSAPSATTTAAASATVQPVSTVQPKKADVTLSYMIPAAQYHEKSYKEMAAKIKEKTGITLDIQVVPDNQYENLLKTKFAANEVPDIFQDIADPTSKQFSTISNDNFVDLSDQPWVKRLVNPNFKAAVDGKYLGAPLHSAAFVMGIIYNKEIFQKLSIQEPKTWAEFLAACDKIKKAGITPLYFTDKDLWTIQIWETIGFGQAISFDQSKVAAVDKQVLENKIKMVNIPGLQDVLQKHLDLVTKGYMNADHLSATYDSEDDQLVSGKAAMVAMAQWEFANFDKKQPGASDKFGMFPIPFVDNAPLLVSAASEALFVPKNGKHVEEAKKAVEAFTEPDVLRAFYDEVPGLNAYSDVPAGKESKALQEVEDKYIKSGNITASAFLGGEIEKGLEGDVFKMFQDMLANGKTPKQVLEAMDKRFAENAKAKKLPGW